MYPVQILLPFHAATFLQALGDGNTLFNSQGSPQTLLESGQDPALASPLALQGGVKEPQMKDTCGQNSVDSLTSASLQLCLESRLRQRLDVNGSPEYDLTWKRWDMLSGPPICALRASARHTSARGSTGAPSGWGTPSTRDFKDSGGGFRAEPRYSSGGRETSSAGDAYSVGAVHNFWSDYSIASFSDGKERRIESGTFPLAHGIPNRVVKLRGYGNAIVPQVAAVFVRSFLESLEDSSFYTQP